jgi:hypothetical protein
MYSEICRISISCKVGNWGINYLDKLIEKITIDGEKKNLMPQICQFY